MIRVFVYEVDEVVVELIGEDYKIVLATMLCGSDEAVRITFQDGTVIAVTMGTTRSCIWRINVEEAGQAEKKLKVWRRKNKEEPEISRTDIFYIDSVVMSLSRESV